MLLNFVPFFFVLVEVEFSGVGCEIETRRFAVDDGGDEFGKTFGGMKFSKAFETSVDFKEHVTSVGSHVEKFVTFNDREDDERSSFFADPKTFGWKINDDGKDMVCVDV